MKIDSLYRDYVQKSRLFLYPALGIKRGHSVTPMQTYVSWENRFKPEDCRLICLYHLRTDDDFRLLERVKLVGNPLFEEFVQLPDNVGAYIFNFEEKQEDFMQFVKGKYSQFSKEHKSAVLSFFKSHSKHHVYIESYLNPKKFIPMYAELLAGSRAEVPTMTRLLNGVGELCSPPDMTQECLKIPTQVEAVQQISLNL
jgi:hypothetical protein